MRKTMIYISLALLAVIIITIAVWGLRILFDLSNPLRQPKEQIRESILKIMPIGTSMDDVLRLAENEKWMNVRVDNESGYLNPGTTSDSEPVGVKSISAGLGGYTNFFSTSVGVLLAFDENSELIEIFVFKQIQGF